MEKELRLSRDKFSEMTQPLRPFISGRTNSPTYKSFSVENKISCCIYYLKDTGSIWMTANTFGIYREPFQR